MKRFLAIFLLLMPVVASGCVGCGPFQPGGSGSEAVNWTPGVGLEPANGPGYVNGKGMDMRKH